MLTIHPILQFAASLLALYVLLLGVARFRRLHLQHKVRFHWKRHVRLGTIALLLWLFGMLLGLVMVKMYWNGPLITGGHGKRSFLLLPLIIFGLLSGYHMNKHRKPRVLLPRLHGVCNLLLIILVFLHTFSGWQVYDAFVLGN